MTKRDVPIALAVLLLLGLAAPGNASPRAATPSPTRLVVLSGRADLVTGGEALVRVENRAGARVTLDGRDVTSAFAPDGEGLLTRLRPGNNELEAAGARLALTDYPETGPVLSGPAIQPWICNTSDPTPSLGSVMPVFLGPTHGPDCETAVRFEYWFRSVDGEFLPYSTSTPPAAGQIASTTTQTGVTVPYIVRVEEGVEDRGIYAVAVLYQPGKPWTALHPQPQWNGKLEAPFGASSAPSHEQGGPESVFDDNALGQGFMVASNGLMSSGEDANQVVAAESLMMLESHIAVSYGQLRYTIGSFCSGAALLQYMVAASYPGLLDGILPSCSFADYWSTGPEVVDCHLLDHYFTGVGAQDAEIANLVEGYRDASDCAAWDETFASIVDPTDANNCNLPSSEVYNASTNPRGVRCTLQDYQQNIWGPRPRALWTPVEKEIAHGFAERPLSNVGVAYGLDPLVAHTITPAQFASLNADIGGLTIDDAYQSQRNSIDASTLATAYRTGQVTDAHQLADVPIIDLRASSNSGEIHTDVHSYIIRARLQAANGTAANQLIWTYPASAPILGVTPPTQVFDQAFDLIDQWLQRIHADHRTYSLAAKVIADKPAAAVDACFVTGPSTVESGPSIPYDEITDPATCNGLYPHYLDPRLAAGQPLQSTILSCQLEPLQRADFPGIAFTTSEWAELRSAFPTGVCDYRRAGQGERRAIPWITYRYGPGGRPLGPPPVSTTS